MAEELLYPGDFIVNAEEFLPGDGAYVEDGKVLSAEVGVAKKDLEKRIVSVEPRKGKMAYMMKAGIEALGVVAKTSEKAGFIDLLPVKNESGRYFPIPASTVLRVQHVKRGFTKSLADEFKVGDIVRARIIEAEPNNVILTTDGPNLGVVKAFCVKCRHAIVKDGNGLICKNCGWKDQRHLANDYREAKV